MSTVAQSFDSKAEENPVPHNVVAVAIDKLVGRVLDIKDAARVFVPVAARMRATTMS